MTGRTSQIFGGGPRHDRRVKVVVDVGSYDLNSAEKMTARYKELALGLKK